MKKGDAIIHPIKSTKRYQWIYCTEDQDETKAVFEAGKFKCTTSERSFISKEDAIINLNKYIKQNDFEKPNRIMIGEIG